MVSNTVSQVTSNVQSANVVPSVEIVNGKPMVTSAQLAGAFEKEHFHVVRDIDNVVSQLPENFIQSNFGEYEWEQTVGFGTRKNRGYTLTRDAFVLIAMSFTGKKALAWKVRYIEAFNAMENRLLHPRSTATLLPYQVIRTLPKSAKDRLNDLVNTKLAHVLTPLGNSGKVKFPNYRRRSRRLCAAPQREKSGLFCFCHQNTSKGVGYILAEQRPGVRETPAAFDKPGNVVLPFFVSNPSIIEVSYV